MSANESPSRPNPQPSDLDNLSSPLHLQSPTQSPPPDLASTRTDSSSSTPHHLHSQTSPTTGDPKPSQSRSNLSPSEPPSTQSSVQHSTPQLPTDNPTTTSQQSQNSQSPTDQHHLSDNAQDSDNDDNDDDGDDDDGDYDPELYRCDVCTYFESDDANPIVICDKCNIMVHVECYGAPLNVKIPDDEWICDRCSQNASNERCVLCPSTEGVMKRTTDWKWAHLQCTQWIPECYYRRPDAMDPIDYLQIPAYRFHSKCMHCKEPVGATMQCSQPGCSNCFHITCGMKQNIELSYQSNKKGGADIVYALCKTHSHQNADKKKKR